MSVTHRRRHRVLVVVHSHLSDEPVHLSPHVISMQSAKSVKSTGTISFDIVPRRNFLNLIFPNDVINVYVDPGDGKSGFIRLFMGYVDRLERLEHTNPKTGAISTMFRLVGSDFQKAFDMTNIYTNQHLAGRSDLVDQKLGINMLGGYALRTMGLTAHGTPADMIENISYMLLGFGTQWTLPPSYGGTIEGAAEANRKRRKNRSKDRLPGALVRQLSSMCPGGLEEALAVVGDGSFEDVETFLNAANVRNKQRDAFKDLSQERREELKGLFDSGKESLRAYRTVLGSVKLKTYSMLDLIDFSFIEAAAIDGYITQAAVWNQSGTLTAVMNSFSNAIVNELIFDLRPVATNNSQNSEIAAKYMDSCFGNDYSREKDELGYNVDGYEDPYYPFFKGNVKAVRYAPAIIFREYPWATVEGVDLGTLRATDTEPLGFVPFGPVFSLKKAEGDRQYRAIYNFNSLESVSNNKLYFSSATCKMEQDHAPMKHLDVVTIRDEDIIKMSVGRSDKDVHNLFTVSAQDPLMANYKFILSAFFPITSAVSIARHGVRPMDISTKFANYGRDQVCAEAPDGLAVNGAIRNMVRWMILKDHWEQNNTELLSGTVTLHGMPHIRVGYRVDFEHRRESYYVENVSHSWVYGDKENKMITSLQLSRGQRNDPFLAYVPPKTATLTDVHSSEAIEVTGGNRDSDGRLSKYFEVLDASATTHATDVPSEHRIIWNDPNLPGANTTDAETNGLFSGKIIYANGSFDVAKERALSPDELTALREATQQSYGNVEIKDSKASVSTNEIDVAEQIQLARKRNYASRNYDEIFSNQGQQWGYIPVAFLRALAKRESDLNENEHKDPAWGLMQVGVDGFPGISGTSGKVLLNYNAKFMTTWTPVDMLDPEKNVTVATELIHRIAVNTANKMGLSLSEGTWYNREFIGIVLAGWNGGYSNKRGTGNMLSYLVANGIDLTLDNLYWHIPAARIAGYDITTQLSKPEKFRWWKGVRSQYFTYLARDKKDGV